VYAVAHNVEWPILQEVVRRLVDGARGEHTAIKELVRLLLHEERLGRAEIQQGLLESEPLVMLEDTVIDNRDAPEVLGSLLGLVFSENFGSLVQLKEICARTFQSDYRDKRHIGQFVIATMRSWSELAPVRIMRFVHGFNCFTSPFRFVKSDGVYSTVVYV
jgi:hypothetical protein